MGDFNIGGFMFGNVNEEGILEDDFLDDVYFYFGT